MNAQGYWGLLGCCTLFGGCAGGEVLEGPRISLEAVSGQGLSEVAAVERFVLRGLDIVDQGDIWLVEGEVSSVSEDRLRNREIPNVIEEARLALTVWRDGDDLVLAPGLILEPGARYSFVALGVGTLGVIDVEETQRAVLRRFGTVASDGEAEVAYCRADPPLWVEQGERGGSLSAGGGGPPPDALDGVWADCVKLPLFLPNDDVAIPPARFGEWLVDPQPIWLFAHEANAPILPPACEDPGALTWVEFSGGCFFIDGPAASVHLGAGAFHVELTPQGGSVTGGARALVVSERESQVIVGPLAPDSEYRVTLTPLDANSLSYIASAQTDPPAPRFVLTEVLADPVGAEPASEWVEVMNVGSALGSLGGLSLSDSSGSVILPNVELPAGGVGLIVRPDFQFESDRIPDRSAIPVVVPTLGGNGLKNSGEDVSLKDPSGVILSRVVGKPTSEGVSLVRRQPWAPDEVASFLPHPEPGSSPGAVFVVDVPAGDR